MGGGISSEQHNAEIQKLNEQWQRTTEEEKKKITEIMRQQNLKFKDLLNEQTKREQLISELRKENIELKEEIGGLKLAIESLTELVNKLAIVGKEDADEDRCSVAKVWNFGIEYEKWNTIQEFKFEYLNSECEYGAVPAHNESGNFKS